ncbi:MAG: GIY-YIG nuclease family protein [Solirubrobacterales bacterium]
MSKLIYAFTDAAKASNTWERITGQTSIAGSGWIKVGETTRKHAIDRVKEIYKTSNPSLAGIRVLLEEPAVRDDGTEFSDHNVHDALVAAGVTRAEGEWFEATIDDVRAAIAHVRSGLPFDPKRTAFFSMRPEQEAAVTRTAAYFAANADATHPPKFLWNAKMRFGKTFTTYELAKKMNWKRVLVLTYKPAVQTAWRDDLLSHVDFTGWHFVDRDMPINEADELLDGPDPVVRFASFQDLNKKTSDGHIKAHNESIHLTNWDCIVLDEYHFGAWRDSARELYDPTDEKVSEVEEPDEEVTEDDFGLSSANYLYLSGTPFRAITNGEFTEDATFNWTYVDEQTAKANWASGEDSNPYRELPGMALYAYEMGAGAAKWAADGEFSGFSLSDYFKATRKTNGKGSPGPGDCEFENPTRITEFLDMLRGKLSEQQKGEIVTGRKPPFPYESEDFKGAIEHSVWFMADVAACFAMRDLLETHPYFSGYEIVVAAGGAAGQGAEAKPPVEAAIAEAINAHKSGTITLSCGKLMTGVTIREWGAILMLRSLESAESYFQAAFRVQSPYAIRNGEGVLEVRKPKCFVFEFDPNRALELLARYGIGLAAEGGETPEQTLGRLVNYLPIFGFTGGTMTKLDASAVLDWATAGIGATALARRWDSPVLVEVNERTLSAVLEHPDLVETLGRIEQFRALVNNAEQVVTSTKLLKKAKREQGGQLDNAQRKEQSDTAKRRREIREKLQKFLARVPVFMYGTDFREAALIDVIKSLDPSLFERVTGLKIKDFELLSDLGLFNPRNMDAAIWQFRQFERSSLRYAADDDEGGEQGPPGGWEAPAEGD